MFESIRSFFTNKICTPINKIGYRFHQKIYQPRKYSHTHSNRASSEIDQLIDASFVNTLSKQLPPKFDSVADRLMSSVKETSSPPIRNQQQLFLHNKSRVLENGDMRHFEVVEQLKQLKDLLQTITSEDLNSVPCNLSFLREIIHNIYLDLHVLLTNLDIKLMLESDVPNSSDA